MPLFTQARHANRFFSRLKGLLFTKELPPEQSLLISPCQQVHTLGMHYAIDLAFINKEQQIIKLVQGLQPNRQAYARGARFVLEMPEGSIYRHTLTLGEPLQWSH